jgi:hypothetical protein
LDDAASEAGVEAEEMVEDLVGLDGGDCPACHRSELEGLDCERLENEHLERLALVMLRSP